MYIDPDYITLCRKEKKMMLYYLIVLFFILADIELIKRVSAQWKAKKAVRKQLKAERKKKHYAEVNRDV